jgi:hypothetical protein
VDLERDVITGSVLAVIAGMYTPQKEVRVLVACRINHDLKKYVLRKKL